MLTGRARPAATAASRACTRCPSCRASTRDFPLARIAASALPQSLRRRRVRHRPRPPSGAARARSGVRARRGSAARSRVFTAHSVYTDYLDDVRWRRRPAAEADGSRGASPAFLDGFDLVLAPSTHVRRVMREWGVPRASRCSRRRRTSARRAGASEARAAARASRPDARSRSTSGGSRPRSASTSLRRASSPRRCALVPDARLVRRRRRAAREARSSARRRASARGPRARSCAGVDARRARPVVLGGRRATSAASRSETGPLTVVEAMACGHADGRATRARASRTASRRRTTACSSSRARASSAAAMAPVLGDRRCVRERARGAARRALRAAAARRRGRCTPRRCCGYYRGAAEVTPTPRRPRMSLSIGIVGLPERRASRRCSPR